jgi:hypothetical protein
MGFWRHKGVNGLTPDALKCCRHRVASKNVFGNPAPDPKLWGSIGGAGTHRHIGWLKTDTLVNGYEGRLALFSARIRSPRGENPSE